MIGWNVRSVLVLGFALVASACGSDENANNATPMCPGGEAYNPILGECVRVSDNNIDDNSQIGDDAGGIPTPDLGAPDDGPPQDDMTTVPDLGCQTDNDGDGAISIECGGDDCDDNNDQRAPHLAERCDEFDNNCDGEINEGLDCSVLAHSDSRLYRVDFFGGTYEDLGETIPNLYDIDTHPDGTTYGIAGDYLYSYDESDGSWTQAAQSLNLSLIENPNGFCIDNDGNAFLTSGSTLRAVNLATGASSVIGSMSPASSSGDCVVNKGNLLFMTSSHTTPDSFSRINGSNGTSTIVGQTGYDGIWGLTAAYSRVFGFTSDGEVIEIDVSTGATTLIVSFPELSFFGSASTPAR